MRFLLSIDCRMCLCALCLIVATVSGASAVNVDGRASFGYVHGHIDIFNPQSIGSSIVIKVDPVEVVDQKRDLSVMSTEDSDPDFFASCIAQLYQAWIPSAMAKGAPPTNFSPTDFGNDFSPFNGLSRPKQSKLMITDPTLFKTDFIGTAQLWMSVSTPTLNVIPRR